MNDTVRKLMELADLYTISPTDACRQALQDELTRLFTPLTDEQATKLSNTVWSDYLDKKTGEGLTFAVTLIKEIEKAHGIGETK